MESSKVKYHAICDECGSEMTPSEIPAYQYSAKTKELGYVEIPKKLKATICKNVNCGSISWPSKSASIISEYVEKSIFDAVNNLPFGDFITMDETASLLGVSKQSLSKSIPFNKKTYSARKGNSVFYYKPSVEEYKKLKDGRVFIGKPNCEIRELQNLWVQSIEHSFIHAKENEFDRRLIAGHGNFVISDSITSMINQLQSGQPTLVGMGDFTEGCYEFSEFETKVMTH